MLSATQITLAYGDDVVLEGVSLDVPASEIVAVVGPSGAGKSSLLLCLCGLLQPQQGRVSLNGTTICPERPRVRDKLRRRHFGFVFQFGDLVPELSLVENVGLPLRLLGWGERQARQEGLAKLRELGIGHLGDKAVNQVSGGELQRAAICRALIHRPAVVLADEPTGALDDENSDLVFAQLLEHARRQDAAVVLVTHQTSLAARADRRFRIGDGRLEASAR